MSDVTESQGQLVAAQEGGALAPAASAADSMLNFIASAVSNPDTDVAKLEALLRMQERVLASDAKAQFNRARQAVQALAPRVKKNGTIDLGEDKNTKQKRGAIPFATFEDVDAVLRPLMTAQGLSVSFSMKPREGGLMVLAELSHQAGHSEVYEFPIISDGGPGRNALQAIGSGFSYGKRYALEGIFNVVREKADDDGRAGGTRYITEEQKEQIIGLLQETDTDVRRFLSTLGDVATVDDMDQAVFPVAVNLLQQKKVAAARKGAAS
ncbi:ERF family protein [Muricoccus aerilatus]|uniref:ERF family protein n=1 Tax=Muricoccus aerilatus TaxID=452982 RepID=UPI0005C1EA78|nr:ERF family protein [Roseomonas aerilata]